MPLTQEEISRKKEAIAAPFSFNQTNGCCGFAGVLMSLLEHNCIEFESLSDAIFNSKNYKGVNNSQKITERLEKRSQMTDSLNNPWGTIYNFENDKPKAIGQTKLFDLKMCVGLMIIFKEYLKQSGKNTIWDECNIYSSKFEDWEYKPLSMKLKNRTSGVSLGYSYKNGDLALTRDALAWLVKLVYGNKAIVDRWEIISNTDFDLQDANKIQNAKASFVSKYRHALTSLSTPERMGAILGVAKNVRAKNNEFKPYDYMSHWVYIPQNQSSQNPSTLELWTWGQKFELDEYLKENDYTAKYALVLTIK